MFYIVSVSYISVLFAKRPLNIPSATVKEGDLIQLLTLAKLIFLLFRSVFENLHSKILYDFLTLLAFL
jgi:hypothetical protein